MKSLRMRIMSFLVPIVIVALSIIIVIVLMNVTNMVEEQSITYERSIAADYAAEIEVELDTVSASLDALAGAFEGIQEDGLANRRISDDMMKGVLERNDILIGVWTVWEADAYDGKDAEYAGKAGSDDTGRYIPYWYRDGNQIALDTLVDYDTEGLGDWNLIARNTGEETIMDPFYYEVGGVDVLMTTIAVPIEVGGSVVGAVGADIALTDLQGLIDDIKIYETGYGSILSNNSIFVAHPNTDLVTQFIGDYIKDQTIIDRIAAGEQFFDRQESSVTGEISHYTYAPIHVGNSTTPWTFVTITKEKEVFADVQNLVLLTAVICVVGVLIFIGALWFVISRIVRPITMASKVIEQFANYDFSDSNISLESYQGRKDEIGIMVNAVSGLKVNTIELMSEISDGAAQVSASSQQLMATSQEAALSVGEVGATVEEIARGAADQAEDTGRGVEGVYELGMLIDKDQGLVKALNALTDHVTLLKNEGTEILTDLVEKTEATAVSTGEVKEVIENTNKSAEQIENASQMIQSIADQTNLLALNAAIEAARAGEAGKGFAVVADEIRKLAEESNKFTQEIASIIDALGSQTQKAVSTMDEVNMTVGSQAESVQATNDKFAGIAEALNEMKQGIDGIMASSTTMTDKKDSISDVMSNLSAISEENAASSEEALASVEEQTAAMDEIAEASKSLSSLAEGMQDSVAKFRY